MSCVTSFVAALGGIESPRDIEPDAAGVAIKTIDVSVPYTSVCRSFVIFCAQEVTGDEGHIEAFVSQELFAQTKVETSSCLVYPIR